MSGLARASGESNTSAAKNQQQEKNRDRHDEDREQQRQPGPLRIPVGIDRRNVGLDRLSGDRRTPLVGLVHAISLGQRTLASAMSVVDFRFLCRDTTAFPAYGP